MVLFFQYEAVLVSKTASENRRLWQLGEAWVFDQMTSDQASRGLKHEDYHHLHSEQNSLQMTRPTIEAFYARKKVGPMGPVWGSLEASFQRVISQIMTVEQGKLT